MIRITKLLYLLDVEYFRDHGKTYTELQWVYYKYGPYSFELEEIILQSGITIEEEFISTDKSIKKLYLKNIEESEIEPMLENYLNKLWSIWGTESLYTLLDFVYYKTEPMLNVVNRGNILNFNTIAKYTGNKKDKMD
ncbi:MAG: type II toxin-antitoxin system antitoxin SocA domain-containing protein [Thermodesulfovibrio sp.]